MMTLYRQKVSDQETLALKVTSEKCENDTLCRAYR